jgi:hypothetical protein
LALDREQMTRKLGGSQASGVMEFVREGATVKALHGGWSACAGLLAARLAVNRMFQGGRDVVLAPERGIFGAQFKAAEWLGEPVGRSEPRRHAAVSRP